ncbi:glycosyltransferase family 39 protein [Pseudonocardia sp. K10HN5]|uniref:Glycosyltransferase family 39 protein n=1 Tax=Pseudonocardia acidicola TaxID=2724939 RepID=A0ABX1SIF7_9PSEU|nr:glycosyltransferase family 39 protein [Pseudonocardia acidicola]
MIAVLAGTALLYLWSLPASGFANEYYAAAVQAGTRSWKAWLFGSLDSGNVITVDKPPAALWIMGLSARIFGFGSWSLLAPQALQGVAAVALLYGAVRRWAGPAAGLVAGAVLALTPAAALMFGFDNPDALLTLLLVAGGYAVVRAVDAGSTRASTRWLVWAGAAIGVGFLTKMGQALLVVPAFGLVYLVAGPSPLRTRLLQLLAALGSMIAAAGWYVLLVELWPATDRPYIGGSTTNSLLELALGYNGLGRLLGGNGNGGGGGGGFGGAAGSSFGGATGLTRLFGSEMGLEISWLLPAALVSLVAGLWLSRRAPRTDRLRAGMLLWGGWLLVSGLVFSYMSGTIHPYYTVALAPAIAALVASAGRELWRRRESLTARVALAVMAAVTAAWSFALLAGSAESYAWIRWVILVAAVPAVLGLPAGAGRLRRVAVVAAAVAALTGIAGSGAYAVATASTAHGGSIPSVGITASAGGGPMGPGPDGRGGSTGGRPGAQPLSMPGATGAPPSFPAGAPFGGSGASGPGGGPGGGTGVNTELAALLHATASTWSAAVSTSQSAAALELATGTAVMSTGGWSGSDPAVTLEQFQAYVAAGAIHYYLGGGQGGGPGGGSGTSSAEIAAWVAANFPATTVGGQTVYHLTG